MVGASRRVLELGGLALSNQPQPPSYGSKQWAIIKQEYLIGALSSGMGGRDAKQKTCPDVISITELQGCRYFYEGTSVQFYNEVNMKKSFITHKFNLKHFLPYSRHSMLTNTTHFPIKNTTRWHGIKVNSYYNLEKFSF